MSPRLFAPGAGAMAASPVLHATKNRSVTPPEIAKNVTSATCPTETARRTCAVGKKGSQLRATVAAAPPADASLASLPNALPNPVSPHPYQETRNGAAVPKTSRNATDSPCDARPMAAKASSAAPSPAASRRERASPPPSASPLSTFATPPQEEDARFSTRSSW